MEKIFEARTKEEAVEKALRELGVSPEHIEVELLNVTKKGLFGLNNKVKIKARVLGLPKHDGEFSSDDDYYDATKHAHETQGQGQNNTKSRAHAKKRPERRTEKTPRRTTEGREPLLDNHEVSPQASEKILVKKELTPVQQEYLEEIVAHLLKTFEIECDSSIEEDEFGAVVMLSIQDENDQNLLIGKHGKNLNAFQSLVNGIMFHKFKKDAANILVDIENYRKKRNQWLVEMAEKKAYKVLQNKEQEILVELNPYDRRVVHTSIKNIKGVETISIGNSYLKKIKIVHVGNKQ